MLKVYAVRDVKADAFAALVCLPTAGLATRQFVEVCGNPQSPMFKNPEDYSLYELGTFDETSGTIVGHRLPVLVMSAEEARSIARVEAEKWQPVLPGTEKPEVKS